MCDCVLCEFKVDKPAYVPCKALSAASAISAAESKSNQDRQLPLLHLIYQMGQRALVPSTRTNLARRATKGPSASDHGGPVQRVIGMFFAQEVGALQVLGLLPREKQMQAMKEIIECIYKGELLNSGSVLRGGWAADEVTRKYNFNIEKMELVRGQIRNNENLLSLSMAERCKKIGQLHEGQIELLEFELELAMGQLGEVKKVWKSKRLIKEKQLHQAKMALAMECTQEEKNSIEAQIAEINFDLNAYRTKGEKYEVQMIAEQISDLEGQVNGLRQSGQSISAPTDAQLKDSLRNLDDLLKKWKLAADNSSREYDVIVERGWDEAVSQDFAMDENNYGNQRLFSLLATATKANEFTKRIFLGLHPSFKYHWTEVEVCKFAKLLSCEKFLAVWVELEKKYLLGPGLDARLGVFVMNSLVPGSYAPDHRLMVQSELDEIATALRPGENICCHSCGSSEFKGEAASSGWIRDHNPPTALLLLKECFPKLQLDFPGFSGVDQILVPQCMRCSIQQSSIVGKVVKNLEENAGDFENMSSDEVWAALKSNLSDQDRLDLERLVRHPMAGWDVENEKKADYAAKLKVEGKLGSFAGVNEDLIIQMGDEHGCHTCVDIHPQTDPFRGMSWIADHQPPTSLVERGLAELPQILYPHCIDCSKKQASLTRKLARLFDECFGAQWRVRHMAKIKALQYSEP